MGDKPPRLQPIGRRPWLRALLLAACGVGPGAPARSRPIKLPAPGPRDTCPVCGMFVARYPYWVATLQWRDGKLVHFDGAKDCFKYLLDLARYARGRSQADIAAIGVTGFYATERIDAAGAWYVIGSDVLGPMGHELVAHDSEAEAREFLADHRGRRILRFADVTLDLLAALDAGKFP